MKIKIRFEKRTGINSSTPDWAFIDDANNRKHLIAKGASYSSEGFFIGFYGYESKKRIIELYNLSNVKRIKSSSFATINGSVGATSEYEADLDIKLNN